MISKLFSKLVVLFLFPNLLFFLSDYLSESKPLIDVLNIMLFSFSIGVCVTYAPRIWQIAFSPWPLRKFDLLCAGIFGFSYATACLSLYSVAWRYLGQPLDFANGDFSAYTKYTFVVAGSFIIAGSSSTGGENIPRIEYVRTGAITAIGLSFGLLSFYVLS